MSLSTSIDSYSIANKNLILVLSVFVITLFWTIYPELSQYNLDRYRDMLENHSWGIRWQWGNSNHPPLFGWITASWFELFPRTNLAYRFLASLNISISLVLMLFISRRFLDKDQQLASLAVALALPLLGFMAMKYNANSAMLPFWAAVFLFYLRILEKPRLVDGLALGLFAGLSMLTKYHSAVLLLAIFIHSTADANVRPLWRKPEPWAAVVVFGLVVLPHIVWLTGNQYSTIRFAALEQGARDLGNILFSQAKFFLAQLAYALPGLIVLGLYRRPKDGFPPFDFAQFGKLFRTSEGRALLAVGLLPVPLTMILGLALWVPLTSNWSIPFFIFAPILLVLLLPKPIANKRWWTSPAFILGFSVLLIALSPIIRSVIISEAKHRSVLPISDIAIAAEALWNKETGTDLAYVGGDPELSYGSSFYVASRPYSIDGTDFGSRSWIDSDALQHAGFMVLCFRKRCTAEQRAAGDADILKKMTIPAIEGAGGPKKYKISVFMHLPKSRSGVEKSR